MTAIPVIPIVVTDFGEIQHPNTYQAVSRDPSTLWTPAEQAEARGTTAGLCGIYRYNGTWHAERITNGGGVGHRSLATRELAHEALREDIAYSVEFWIEKVRWREAGDRAGRFPVIRAAHEHYVLGDGASPIRGHGGREFAFRMLATGDRVTGVDVWSQGLIPVEFRALLPDNAERVESDGEIARRRQGEEDRAAALAAGWTVAPLDNGFEQWRDPSGKTRMTDTAGRAPAQYMIEHYTAINR